MTNKKVLVCGSVHLDVAATADGTPDIVDDTGRLEYWIGGTAFNIAADLRHSGVKHTYLCSAVNRGTVSGGVVYTILRKSNLSTKYVMNDPELKGDSGFVAHFGPDRKELLRAVSAMQVEFTTKIAECVSKQARKFDYIIFDCNLSEDTIHKITETAKSHKIPLVGALTSDLKCRRAVASRDYADKCLFMNHIEARVLQQEMEASDFLTLRKKLNAKKIVVTHEEKGLCLVTDSGEQQIPAPISYAIDSVIGAGDAVCASYVLSEIQNVDFKCCMTKMVKEVLEKKYANLLNLTPAAFAHKVNEQVKRFVILKWLAAMLGVLGVVWQIAEFIFDFSLQFSWGQ